MVERKPHVNELWKTLAAIAVAIIAFPLVWIAFLSFMRFFQFLEERKNRNFWWKSAYKILSAILFILLMLWALGQMEK